MAGDLNDERPGPPAGGPAWRAVMIPLFALDVLTAFTVGMVPPILPLMVDEWQLNGVQAGLVSTAYGVGRLAASYPALHHRARYGTRATVFLGLLVLIVGSVVCGVGRSYPLFLVGRAVMGFGSAVAFLGIFAELLDTTPAAWRGRISNAFEGLAIMSLATGGALASAAASRGGWRAVFIGAVPVIGLALLVRSGLHPAAGRSERKIAGPAVGAQVLAFAPLLVAGFSLSFTWAGLWTTLTPLLGAGPYGLPPSFLGLVMSTGYVAEVLGLAAIGVVIDRVRREPLFLGGAVVVAAGGLLLGTGGGTGAFVIALVLIGGGYAIWMVPSTILADRAGTPVPPGLLAVFRVVMDLGMISGPVVLGLLIQAASARTAAAVAGLALVAGAIPLVRSRRPAGRPTW